MREFGRDLRRYSDMEDVEVAKGDPDVRGWDVALPNGDDIGEVKDMLVDADVMKVKALEVDLDGKRFKWTDNRRVAVPMDAVQIDDDNDQVIVNSNLQEIGSLPVYSPSATAERARQAAPPRSDEAGRDRLTRSEEELRIGKREVEAGEVRIGKHVETEHVAKDVPRERERVHVERRPVSGATASGASITDAEIRVPVHEEEVVVEKRPVVREEVVVSKERVSEPQHVEADLRKERVDIDQQGDVLDERARRRRDER